MRQGEVALDLPPALACTQLGWQSSVRENSFNLSRNSAFPCPAKTGAAAPEGTANACSLTVGKGKGESLPFSSALPIPFPSGTSSPVLMSSRLLSQFRWIGNFSPILFGDVGKTSSINPHIRTMYSIKDTGLPKSIHAESLNLQHWCPQ